MFMKIEQELTFNKKFKYIFFVYFPPTLKLRRIKNCELWNAIKSIYCTGIWTCIYGICGERTPFDAGTI